MIKLNEQIGFCYYQTGQETKARQLFTWVLKMYQKHEAENDYNELAVPTEMFQCLSPDDEIIIQMKKLNIVY